MKRRIVRTAALFVAILASCGGVRAGWLPDPTLSTYTWSHQGPGFLALMVRPDGAGPSFTEARSPAGVPADATITLTVLDPTGVPVRDYPAEDLYLVWAGGSLAVCPGGTAADGPTDAQGRTTFSIPLRAGGWSEASCRVFISGMVVVGPGLPLRVNSPDLDGNLVVNLSDVALFAGDYYDPLYGFRSDLAHDGEINLADVHRLAVALGVECD